MSKAHKGHDHNDRDYAHAVESNTDVRYLIIALLLISGFLVGEVVAAILGDSLALLADDGHMLTDVGALVTSAWVIRLVKKPAQGPWTSGLKRAEILSAAVNGVTLTVFALVVAFEAIQRLIAPQHVTGVLVLTIALVGIVINVVATWVFAKANRTSLNIRGAYAQILADLYAFIGTAVAGLA